MSEMNEKNLEQVAGGGKGANFNELEWTKRNCHKCAKFWSYCIDKPAMVLRAKERAAQGLIDDCPDRR